jgi:hypothetical protein
MAWNGRSHIALPWRRPFPWMGICSSGNFRRAIAPPSTMRSGCPALAAQSPLTNQRYLEAPAPRQFWMLQVGWAFYLPGTKNGIHR